jgi:hypothetical protein
MAKSLDDIERDLMRLKETVRKLEGMNNRDRFTWKPVDNITFELEMPSWNPISKAQTKERLKLPKTKKNGRKKRKV